MPEILTQENKLISVAVDGQPDDTLLLQSMMGTESISRTYLLQLDVLTTKADLDFSTILGQRASITMQTSDPNTPRYFNGFVSRFVQTDGVDGLSHYRMDVVPWIWFLGLHVDCRIFHNMTIPEIVQKVLNNSPAQQKDSIDPNLQSTYSKLEYCVQYRESSLNFISRLMEHAGIFYYFTHTETGHTLHLSDSSSLCDPIPAQSSVSYLFRNAGEMHEETILTLHGRQEVKTGQHTHTNYNFKTPSADLKTSETTVVNVGQNSPLEVFEYPSPHTNANDGKTLSKIRMQEQEAAYHQLTGSGVVRNFISGYKFTIKDHPQSSGIDRNIEYLITEVQHMVTVGAGYVAGVGGESYSNQFMCIPASVPYRPPRISPKPLIYGVQTAIVIGKADDSDKSGSDEDDGSSGSDGEEIWVDKYGRIIVRFPWDREGLCSCRARVSQQWAGQGWGFITIPRVGQEVLVSFINGDPDHPIVTGCVYNGEQTVPYTLPEYQTRSTFKSRSSKGGGEDNYNELRFEDKTSEEQVFIRGEKDYDTRIKNDSREWIGNNQSIMVQNDRMEKVTGNESIQIGGNRLEKVGGDESIQIDGKQLIKIKGDVSLQIQGKQSEKITGDMNHHVSGNWNQKTDQNVSIQAGENMYEKSGQNYAHEAGMAIHLKAGMTMVLEAGMQLSLKAGGSFIDIGPAGIAISGSPLVMINSGGSAGSGSGSSPTSPDAPADPKDPTDPDEADDGSKGTKMNG
jgi:type VI secretion system secreted protein VgrG